MEMVKGVHALTAFYFLKDKEGKRVGPILGKGTGILLKNDYVLTARHVVDENNTLQKIDFQGNTLELKVLIMGDEEAHSGLEIVKLSKKYDLALLKIKNKTKLNKLGVNLGNSDELKRGNLLYFIGNPHGMGIHQNQAIVSTYETKDLKEDGFKGVFNINSSIGQGYSGGPVFAIKDGKFELIGVVSTTTTFNGQIVSIKYALEEFKEYLQK